jgi:hypothetical protein
MSEKVRADFEEMKKQLRLLEKEYHPHGENLYFEGLSKVDAALFHELLKLSRRAIEIVKDDDQRYSNKTAYAHSMHDFWYDHLLLTSLAAQRIINSGGKNEIPDDVILNIFDDLIYICGFSTVVLGDLYSRNREALCNTLLAFHSDGMIQHFKNSYIAAESEQIIRFLDTVLKGVEGVINNSK